MTRSMTRSMTREQASRLAKKYSEQYFTFWYVREVQPGKFQPWAHSSDDARTIETWYCGQDWSEI